MARLGLSEPPAQVYAVRARRLLRLRGRRRQPRAGWDRHDLKGERERIFSQLLADLDLHHPPCLAPVANQAFYTLAALAYNLLTALTLSELPAAHHG